MDNQEYSAPLLISLTFSTRSKDRHEKKIEGSNYETCVFNHINSYSFSIFHLIKGQLQRKGQTGWGWGTRDKFGILNF